MIKQKKKLKVNYFTQVFKLTSFSFLILFLILSQAQSFTAFEAHIVGVTAQIVHPCPDGYSITGHKFYDRNGDGVWDQGTEEGLGGWIIELDKLYDERYDYTDDGYLDGNDVAFLIDVADDTNPLECPSGKVCNFNPDGWVDQQDVDWLENYINNLPQDLGNRNTNPDGSYSFVGLETGIYTIAEVLEDGWTPTTDQSVTFQLACGENVVNFGNKRGSGPECGDGIPDPGEQCDDGNNEDGDSCSAQCTVEPSCGDGIPDPGEECDDGNVEDGDGCSAQCTVEPIDTCMKINEVYYDPDTTHGDSNDEWIELYNACDYEVNLKNWYLKDNGSTEEKIHQNYLIGSGQFVVIASNASTWSYWPDIPDNAFKIALGGGVKLFDGLNNDGDRVFLYDNNDNLIDTVSWGTDTSAFNPSVADVAKGHSIARNPKGYDTDQASDWEDLVTPNPGTNPHALSLIVMPIITIPGCMDELALNFNINATEDDGSCEYKEEKPDKEGCTDETALNYNPDVKKDDGSCEYPIFGCTDELALNFNIDATQDDSSCEYAVLGCMDSEADNYNPNATENNNSCTYPEPDPILGCKDETALNYSEESTEDDGSCEYPPDNEPEE